MDLAGASHADVPPPRTAAGGALVLVRHGQSEDNERDLFSGLRDPALTPRGVEEARETGRALMGLGFRFSDAFTSELRRAQHTLSLILAEFGQPGPLVRTDAALNERDYGALAGLNKTDARARFGRDQVRMWRKSYAAVPPGGESLAMTGERAWAYFERAIAPRIRDGGRVLLVGHGNTLRAMLMRLEGIDAETIEDVNVGTAEFMVYEPDDRSGRLTRSPARPHAGTPRG
jgi:2,3-bisphosphoglycerate-dependent phosphoglycerate mutase